jgi:Golgi SNAP receptor complex protein 2
MELLYNRTKGSFGKIHEDLGKFERTTTQDEVKQITIELNKQFDEILSNIDKLDIYVSKEPINRRADTKFKVDQLKYDFRHLQAAYKSLQYKR